MQETGERIRLWHLCDAEFEVPCDGAAFEANKREHRTVSV